MPATRFSFTSPAAPPLTPEQALALAGQLQGQHRLREAEQVLHQILQAAPNHAPALHLLGVVAYQAGNLGAAAELMQRAIGLLEPRADVGLKPDLQPTSVGRTSVRQGASTDSVGLKPDLQQSLALFHANLCEVLRRLGRQEEALAAGQRAVALNPQLAMAHSNLGIVHYDRKDYAAAAACQQRALALAPNLAPALNNLGNIYREQHDKTQAMALYRQAHAADPSYLEPISNLGALLLEEDAIAEAEATLQQALRLAPDYPEAVCNLGGVRLAQEHNEEALARYRRALQLRPVYVEAQMGLAKALQALDNLNDAELTAVRAVQMDEANPKAHALLAGIRTEQGNVAAAEAGFLRALTLKPDSEDALLGLAHLCTENGEFERARTLLQQALQHKPDNLAAHIALVQNDKVVADDPHVAALLREAKKMGTLSDNRQLSLHFALGKCYDDLKDYDRAFAHYLAGCKLKRAKFDYDAEATARQFAELKTIFSRAYVDSLRGAGEPSDAPLFVLGMPRSGTTLTEQILASHPDVFGAGELPDLLRIAHRKTLPTVDTFPANLAHLNAATLTAWGQEYLAAVRQRAPQAQRLTDKMPANFFAVPLIHLMLPNARIIHVRRNPVDTCVSCFMRLFQRKQEHTYDLAELGRYYADYARLMQHWREVLPPGAFYEVQYEDIVADTEGEARKLLEYCGLAWDDACLDFHQTQRQVRTASVVQVRQPIYATSVERWRKYEKHLGPLLDALQEFAPPH